MIFKMADSHLDELESRLELLEKKVFGGADKDAHFPKGVKPFQCTDSLLNTHTKLTKSVAGKKKINKVYDRLQELQTYLHPASADELTLSEAAKAEIILAEEEFLLQQAARLETLKQLQDTLDSEHVRAVPSLTGTLQDLSQIQLKQQDQAATATDEVRDLLSAYNSIITLLSKQFVKWDETITSLEKAANPEKQAD